MRSGDARCGHCGSDLGLTVPSGPSEAAGLVEVRPLPRLEFSPGQTFADRFTVIERVAEGGMGVVYKAIDTALDTVVALKLIQPALVGNAPLVERFRREVRVTRRLAHPNVCRVFDIGSHNGVLFLSMEWVEGETLQHLLRQAGTLREGKALEIAERIARALSAAHEAGVVHRDLKPANVMIDRSGRVVVLDFGLAREEGGERLAESRAQLGTLLYMAPEQRSSSRVDARADLYALGLILREMLTGRRLEPGTALPADFSEEVDPRIAAVLHGLLAERPEDRTASAGEAGAAIAGILADR